MKRFALVFLCFFLLVSVVLGATRYTVASGAWVADAATVWDDGVGPVNNDTVTITAGHTVTFDADIVALATSAADTAERGASKRNELIVLTTRLPYRILQRTSDPVSYEAVELTGGRGDCVGQRAVDAGEGAVFFLGRSGVRALTGDAVQDISSPVAPAFLEMDIDARELSLLCYQNKSRRVFAFIPQDGETAPNVAYMLDFTLLQGGSYQGLHPWTMFSGYDIDAVMNVVDADGEEYVLTAEGGYLRRLDVGTSDI